MNSIRWRLLLSLLGVLALAAAVMGTLTYRTVLAETEALFDYQLRQMALSLRDQGAIAGEQASALADEDLDFVVQIWSVDGRAIYASRAHSALPDRAALGFADVNAGGQRWRSYGVVARDRVIQVAQPARIRSGLAAGAALRSVAPLAGLALPLAALLWALVSWLLRPLRQVAQQVGSRDAATLAPLPLAGLPAEVTPLVAALNALLARLDASLSAQRGFVADAAHELRTPLQALKLQLQALQRAPDATARQDALAALGSGIDRAARLVEQLLALARSEPGAAAIAPQPLDLAALAGEVLAELWPLAQARHIALSLVGEEQLRWQGEPAALYALLRNLVDNALRYTPEGGQVQVQVQRGPEGGAQLVVDDSGLGIPPAERERVFDRFYRRSSGDAGGSGLGLAIVQAVAARHGAQVTLAESPLGGLRVQVSWPAAGPA
jgi:signal transduction histidine kinase